MQRLILTPAEKSELLRIGAEFWHDIDGLMEVARPATYRRWLAQPVRSETILNFRMDRIHAAEVLAESITFEPEFVLEDYAARAFGVYQDPAQHGEPRVQRGEDGFAG